MRRTRYIALPVRAWQYVGLLVVSLACLTLGLVSRDKEGRAGNLVGPEMEHQAPHEMDACPNLDPFTKLPSSLKQGQDQVRALKMSRETRSIQTSLVPANLGISRSRSTDRVSRARFQSRTDFRSAERLARQGSNTANDFSRRTLESRLKINNQDRSFRHLPDSAIRESRSMDDLAMQRLHKRSMDTESLRESTRRVNEALRGRELSVQSMKRLARNRNDLRRNNRALRNIEARNRMELVIRRDSRLDQHRRSVERSEGGKLANERRERVNRLDITSNERREFMSSRSPQRFTVGNLEHDKRNNRLYLVRVKRDTTLERTSEVPRTNLDQRRVDTSIDRRSDRRSFLDSRRVSERKSTSPESQHRGDTRINRQDKEQRSERRLSEQRSDRRLVEQRFNHRSAERRVDRRTPEHRSDRRIAEQRSDRRSLEQRSDRRSLEQRSDRRSLERRSDRRSLEQRSDRRSLEQRFDRRSLEQKSSRRTVEQRVDRRSLERRSDRRLSERRADRRISDQRSERRLSEQRFNHRSTEQRVERRLPEQRSDRRLSEQRFNHRSTDQKSNRRLPEQSSDRRHVEQRFNQRSTEQGFDHRLPKERFDRRLTEQRLDRRLPEHRLKRRSTEERFDHHLIEQRLDRRNLNSRRLLLQRYDVNRLQRTRSMPDLSVRSSQKEHRLTDKTHAIQPAHRSTDKDSRNHSIQRDLSNNLAIFRRHSRSTRVQLRRLATHMNIRSLESREKLLNRNNDILTRSHSFHASDFLKKENSMKYTLTFEIIRQALVIGLCTVYSLSIFCGKRSFVSNFVRQTPRFILW